MKAGGLGGGQGWVMKGCGRGWRGEVELMMEAGPVAAKRFVGGVWGSRRRKRGSKPEAEVARWWPAPAAPAMLSLDFLDDVRRMNKRQVRPPALGLAWPGRSCCPPSSPGAPGPGGALVSGPRAACPAGPDQAPVGSPGLGHPVAAGRGVPSMAHGQPGGLGGSKSRRLSPPAHGAEPGEGRGDGLWLVWPVRNRSD